MRAVNYIQQAQVIFALQQQVQAQMHGFQLFNVNQPQSDGPLIGYYGGFIPVFPRNPQADRKLRSSMPDHFQFGSSVDQ